MNRSNFLLEVSLLVIILFYAPVIVGGLETSESISTNGENQKTISLDTSINILFSLEWGREGRDDGEFDLPIDVAVDNEGRVYIADADNDRIQVFDNEGRFITKWGSRGRSQSDLWNPHSVAVDKDGNVYVVDQMNEHVKVFNPEGALEKVWDHVEMRPMYVAVGQNDRIYVVEFISHRIRVFSPDGTLLQTWNRGRGVSRLTYPHGIAVNGNGTAFVVDRNDRILVFDKKGNFIRAMGQPGSEDGEFETILDIALDNNGNLFLVDKGNSRIQVLDQNGTFLMKWGILGSEEGEFNYPSGIAIDKNNNVYIADRKNYRIQKFIRVNTETDCYTDNDCAHDKECMNGRCIPLVCDVDTIACDHQCMNQEGGRCCDGEWRHDVECCRNEECKGGFLCISNTCMRTGSFSPEEASPWLRDVLEFNHYELLHGITDGYVAFLLARERDQSLTYGNKTRIIIRVELFNDDLLYRVIGEVYGTNSMAFTRPDLIILNDEWGHIQRIIRMNDTVLTQEHELRIDNTTSVSSDGLRFLLHRPKRITYVESVAPYRIIKNIPLEFESYFCSSYGNMVAVVPFNERRVDVYNNTNHSMILSSPEFNEGLTSVLVHDNRAYGGTQKGRLVAWNLTSESGERVMSGHTGALQALVADDLYVYSGGVDGVIIVRETDTLFGRFRLRGHEAPVKGIIPLGERILTFDNTTIRLWERPRRHSPTVVTPAINITQRPILTPNETLDQNVTDALSINDVTSHPIERESVCGDGMCGDSESSEACCQDCGCSPGMKCVDDVCRTSSVPIWITPDPDEGIHTDSEESTHSSDLRPAAGTISVLLLLGIVASSQLIMKKG